MSESGAVSLVLAGALLVWVLLIGAAGGTREAGAAEFVRERLGPRTAYVVHGLYFGGFAIGQAVVVGAAGEFAGAGTTAYVIGVVVLLLAAALAGAGVSPSPSVRQVRTLVVLALTAVWWLAPRSLDLDTGDAFPGGSVLLLVPLLFAWVGLESTVPPLRSSSRAGTFGVVLGLAATAVLYAVLLDPRDASAPGGQAGESALGWFAALLLTTFCLTNLLSVGARWTRLRPAPTGAPTGRGLERQGIAVATGIALAALSLAAAFDWSVALLLLGPGTATALIYALLALSAIRQRQTQPVS
ncbi:hypothetical protein [Streptomyces sp. NPDC057702]|uniref:hypothetical protein n=1 Tax=unclassified Streptomyces TaxID=2593676 RepID=UPI0036A67DC4